MSDNPLDSDPERDARIRERAYHLWDSEGRPHGRDLDYWERARELIGMEEHPSSGQLPNPIAEGIDPEAPDVVDEAFLQDNLGEFPGNLTDQGDRLQTPAPRSKPKAAPAEVPVKAAKGKDASKPKDAVKAKDAGKGKKT